MRTVMQAVWRGWVTDRASQQYLDTMREISEAASRIANTLLCKADRDGGDRRRRTGAGTHERGERCEAHHSRDGSGGRYGLLAQAGSLADKLARTQISREDGSVRERRSE